jgi:hypothetical protein
MTAPQSNIASLHFPPGCPDSNTPATLPCWDREFLFQRACLATTAFASRIARASSPVRSKDSLATFVQSSFRAGVDALCVSLICEPQSPKKKGSKIKEPKTR